MTEILAVFRSRAQAVDAAAKLKNSGIFVNLVDNPSEANVGCGLSVKINRMSLQRARLIIARGGYSSFSGYFFSYYVEGRKYYRRLK